MVPRFSFAALICITAVGISGVVESAVTLDGWAELWESNRGHLMLVKVIALVVLAAVGFLHRRHTMVVGDQRHDCFPCCDWPQPNLR